MILGTHAMSTWFYLQNQVWHRCTPSVLSTKTPSPSVPRGADVGHTMARAAFAPTCPRALPCTLPRRSSTPDWAPCCASPTTPRLQQPGRLAIVLWATRPIWDRTRAGYLSVMSQAGFACPPGHRVDFGPWRGLKCKSFIFLKSV
jgi:hypothetical protein